MNKFTDFSDQVTFVSSELIGRDFSEYHKFEDKKTHTIYWLTTNQWNRVKNLSSFKEKLKMVTSFNPPTGKKPPKSSGGSENNGKKGNKKDNPGWYDDLTKSDEILQEVKRHRDPDRIKLAEDYNKATFDRATTAVNTDILQNQINNMDLERKKAKLKRKEDIREAGGIINYGVGSLLEKISNTDAAKKYGLEPFRNTSSTVEIKDESGKVRTITTPRTSTLAYLSNGDKVAKAAGEVMTTASKTAKGIVANTALGIAGYDSTKGKSGRLAIDADIKRKLADKSGSRSDERKAKKAERLVENDKAEYLQKVGKAVGAVVEAPKLFLSQKAQEREIRKGGMEGLGRKRAQIHKALGIATDEDRILLGDTEGMGWGAKLKSKVVNHKIKSANRKYQDSLNAQYAPQSGYVQYRYPVAAGFSETQVSALNDILSKDFSDEVSEFEGLNLSWQPEEYAKLNTILEADFETLDAQIAETQPDMSEKKVKEEEKVDEQQVEDSQSGEIDVSDTIDYNNLDPETMTALVDTSYYEVPKEEKEYQEMIAKGFAEKDNSYNSFLESMSDLADKASF